MIRSSPIKNGCRKFSDNMGGHKHNLTPKGRRKGGLEKQSLSDLKQVLMLEFNHPILLGCIRAGTLIGNPKIL